MLTTGARYGGALTAAYHAGGAANALERFTRARQAVADYLTGLGVDAAPYKLPPAYERIATLGCDLACHDSGTGYAMSRG